MHRDLINAATVKMVDHVNGRPDFEGERDYQLVLDTILRYRRYLLEEAGDPEP